MGAVLGIPAGSLDVLEQPTFASYFSRKIARQSMEASVSRFMTQIEQFLVDRSDSWEVVGNEVVMAWLEKSIPVVAADVLANDTVVVSLDRSLCVMQRRVERDNQRPIAEAGIGGEDVFDQVVQERIIVPSLL